MVLSAAGPSCAEVEPPGAALGSKRVAALAYHPGSCAAAGGEEVGEAEPSGTATFCCVS